MIAMTARAWAESAQSAAGVRPGTECAGKGLLVDECAKAEAARGVAASARSSAGVAGT